MKWMNSYIEIGNLVFRNRASSIDIESSRKEITSTATIRIPRYSKLLTQSGSAYLIKPGQQVVIRFGYDGEFKQEWKGYVAIIKPSTPLEIICEDAMWLLKQKQVSKSWESISLKNLLQELAPGVTTNCPEINLSPVRFDKLTIAQALAKLKEECGIDVFFRGGTLYAGLAYGETDLAEVNYHLQRNIPEAARQNGLVFKKKDDVKLKIKAIAILEDNKRIEVEVGDPDGEQRTQTFYNITTKAELEAIAKERINQLKYDGYRGDLTTFGWPVPVHSGRANIKDDNYPELSSSVFIDSVKTSYSNNGYRQVVEMGRSITAVLAHE